MAEKEAAKPSARPGPVQVPVGAEMRPVPGISHAKPSMAPYYPGEKDPVATAGTEGRFGTWPETIRIYSPGSPLFVLLLITTLISPLLAHVFPCRISSASRCSESD